MIVDCRDFGCVKMMIWFSELRYLQVFKAPACWETYVHLRHMSRDRDASAFACPPSSSRQVPGGRIMENTNPSEAERARYARTFNPYQLTENCFYVALARLMSVDSRQIAAWAGLDETNTAKVGITMTS